MNPKASIGKYFFNKKRPDEGVFYALRQANGKSFVEDCAKRDPYRLSRILKTLKRIFDYGCSFGFDSKTIVEIKGARVGIAVFEVRLKGTVIRVAAYIHAGYIPIYLFDFDTHQGSANNLPKRFIKRAQEMAVLAKSCAEAYDFSDYSGER